LYIPYILWNYL